MKMIKKNIRNGHLNYEEWSLKVNWVVEWNEYCTEISYNIKKTAMIVGHLLSTELVKLKNKNLILHLIFCDCYVFCDL